MLTAGIPNCAMEPHQVPRRGEWMANSLELHPVCRERRVVAAVRNGRSGQYLVHAGAALADLFRIERGWAVQFRFLPDGRRHIIDYFIPGDWCDVAYLSADQPSDAVRAITDYTAYAYGADRARVLIAANLHLASQFQSMLSRRLRLQSERALGLGRKTATERLAHLLCEIFARMQAVGLAEDGVCFMPLTQTDLADLTGLTPIHVNRVLQQLRAADMIGLAGKRLTVVSPERLERLAMFDGDYLLEASRFDLSMC